MTIDNKYCFADRSTRNSLSPTTNSHYAGGFQGSFTRRTRRDFVRRRAGSCCMESRQRNRTESGEQLSLYAYHSPCMCFLVSDICLCTRQVSYYQTQRVTLVDPMSIVFTPDEDIRYLVVRTRMHCSVVLHFEIPEA